MNGIFVCHVKLPIYPQLCLLEKLLQLLAVSNDLICSEIEPKSPRHLEIRPIREQN